ncbi:bacteriohemerythrin [Methylocystis sp. MJC1]|jgi:hemerythrin|uniref:bacteriohemerythrin n=1 Tax=Methylocystis sp. MJC1 TaxID=2654282 RepID=UPI0013EC477A|nr:bacteriohemerythrin [Methylocystis sp. MJC1]KAF2989648.1 Bacteriohemerythrin [Methylocystis sp. MJC1]MBU6525644.1 hemerythrin family protein [Methylocystis sp. MJC1]UZX12118.1 bacteriohemerythrin [Methylocystis sp. MJC1]
MSLITWTKEQFATNVSAHDAEHQEIFRLVNVLGDAVASGDRTAIGKELDALIDYVVKHFAAEEANFAQYGYPAAAGHKAEHDKLVETCADLQKKFHAGETEVTGETAAFVVGWLTDHIPNIDKLYGPYLNAKGVA